MSNLKHCSRANDRSTGAGTFYALNKAIVGAFIISIFFSGCAQSMDDYREKSSAIDKEISKEYAGLYADSINGMTHNFIRTADMKLEVENVVSASNFIDAIVGKAGGYTAKSEIKTEITSRNSVRIKKDSLLDTRVFVTKNSLIIRVPASHFDSIIRKITDLGLFLDYRSKSAEDVKADLYANSEQKKSYQKFSRDVERSVKKSDKLSEIVNANEGVLEKALAAKQLENESYKLYEQVNYSVINVELYQQPQTSNVLVFSGAPVQPYETPYSTLLIEALIGGMTILKKILLFLAWSWGLVLPAILIFLLCKRYRFFKIRKQGV